MTKTLSLSKLAAVLVGVSMVAGLAFAFAAQRAHALTLSELVELFIALEVIPADKADEARSVLSSEDTGTGSGATMSCSFTRSLTVGDTGNDVMELQQFLNAKGFTVAASGPGSAGAESSYFGSLTAAAVSSFQNAYAADVLVPLGLTSGTGYFGASTRAKVNSLCSTSGGGGTTPPPPPPIGDDDDDMMGDDDDDTLSGGETSLEDFNRLGTPSNVDLQEGDEEEVAGWEFDVEDADAELKRVDFFFEAETDTTDDDEPWKYFDSVQLYVDGDMVAEEDADSSGDWDDQNTSFDSTDATTDAFKIRFSGLDEVFNEGDNPNIVVGVTMQGNLDSDQEGQTWNVWIPDNGLRVIDGSGVNQYLGTAGNDPATGRTFDIESAGQGEELKVALSSSNPDASTIKVDENDTTDDVTVLVFTLEAEENDIEITSFPLTIYTGTLVATTTYDDVVANITLEIDGVDHTDETVTDATASTTVVTWDIDRGDLIVDADTKVTGKVIIDLKKQVNGTTYTAGETIKASVTSANADLIEAEGADDLTATNLSGSAVGDMHQMLAEGVFAEIVSTDADITSTTNGTDDVAEFQIKFDLTAFDDTFYVASSSANAVTFQIEDSNGDAYSTTTSAVLSSTADKDSASGAYRIDDGNTETFTLNVSLDTTGGVTGFFRLQLLTVNYGDAGAETAELAHSVSPTEDFETDYAEIKQSAD